MGAEHRCAVSVFGRVRKYRNEKEGEMGTRLRDRSYATILVGTFVVLMSFSSTLSLAGCVPHRVLDSVPGMKKSFIEMFEKDFEIISDTIESDKEGVYCWLVTMKPRREGFYTIRHICQRGLLHKYQNISFECQVSVAKKGIRRFVYIDDTISRREVCFDIWVGDSITIPIYINNSVTAHSFSDVSHYKADHNFDKKQIAFYHDHMKRDFSKWDVENRVPELECIGITMEESLHRALQWSTISYRAVFRAKGPGKFNLTIGKYKCIPLTVLPKTELINTLVDFISILEWSGKFSEFSHKKTQLENITLRIDDVLIVTFLSYVDYEDDRRRIEKKLKITKSDFSMKNDRYDYWIE
jgi:hypothetical protein